jgi:hypothetical protein
VVNVAMGIDDLRDLYLVFLNVVTKLLLFISFIAPGINDDPIALGIGEHIGVLLKWTKNK